MKDQPSTISGDLPPEAARRLEAVCNRFEAAWKSLTPPRVEDFLDGWTGTERDALLRELVALDVVYRRARGQAVRAEEYQIRFPDLTLATFKVGSADAGEVKPDSAIRESIAGPAGNFSMESPR